MNDEERKEKQIEEYRNQINDIKTQLESSDVYVKETANGKEEYSRKEAEKIMRDLSYKVDCLDGFPWSERQHTNIFANLIAKLIRGVRLVIDPAYRHIRKMADMKAFDDEVQKLKEEAEKKYGKDREEHDHDKTKDKEKDQTKDKTQKKSKTKQNSKDKTNTDNFFDTLGVSTLEEDIAKRDAEEAAAREAATKTELVPDQNNMPENVTNILNKKGITAIEAGEALTAMQQFEEAKYGDKFKPQKMIYKLAEKNPEIVKGIEKESLYSLRLGLIMHNPDTLIYMPDENTKNVKTTASKFMEFIANKPNKENIISAVINAANNISPENKWSKEFVNEIHQIVPEVQQNLPVTQQDAQEILPCIPEIPEDQEMHISKNNVDVTQEIFSSYVSDINDSNAETFKKNLDGVVKSLDFDTLEMDTIKDLPMNEEEVIKYDLAAHPNDIKYLKEDLITTDVATVAILYNPELIIEIPENISTDDLEKSIASFVKISGDTSYPLITGKYDNAEITEIQKYLEEDLNKKDISQDLSDFDFNNVDMSIFQDQDDIQQDMEPEYYDTNDDMER